MKWLPHSAWVCLSLALATPAVWADAPPLVSRFDPARHMRVSEVRPGMTGYGLTVFTGSKIEKFEVEVLSILKDFNPKFDVVLIRAKGEYLEHTGSIAGMSGSPIYLRDESGRARLIGAFAYGWPLTKDPVAGVQPIEYMLDLPAARPATASSRPAAQGATDGRAGAESARPAGRASWPMKRTALLLHARNSSLHRRPEASVHQTAGFLLGEGRDLPPLQPLATPLMVSGASSRLVEMMGPAFGEMGFSLMQAGSGSSAATDADIPLAPGSVLAVPLLTGDTDMTAIGTCTEVLGDQVWGFGHPFNNEGPISLPMGAGEIQGIIANLQTSFKLGSMSRAGGTLLMDGSVGVAGQVGPVASTVPIDFRVSGGGLPQRNYHFQAARHARFTPLLAGMALAAAMTGSSDLPQFNTVDYDLALEFADGQTLRIQNRAVNTSPGELFNQLGAPITAASDNPFRRVLLKRIGGDIRIDSEAHAAQLLDVIVPRAKYRPGETLKAFATYKPFHGEEAILPLSMDLPRDLPAGAYQLVISDSQRYMQEEVQAEPFRFTAQNLKDVFGVLKDMAAVRDDALYARLVRQPDGVAIGRTALQRLPSSRRQILLGGGHSAVTAFVASAVKVIPTDNVMSGSAEFVITIDTSPKVVIGSPRAGKNEAAAADVRVDESKPELKSGAPAK